MRGIKKLIRFIILFVLIIAVIFVATGYKKYKTALSELPLNDAVMRIKGIENYTAINSVPQMFIDAVVATEDRRFFLHDGFDIIGTARAIIVDIQEKKLVEGGSTITQQLAKNMYFLNENTPIRKIAEIFMACEIENHYSKNEILELYFNTIYYGSGYYCVHDAAMGYFNKLPSQMSDYEATLLAGVPNAPSVYSPKVNPDLAKKRQEKIIDCLIDEEYITAEQAEALVN